MSWEWHVSEHVQPQAGARAALEAAAERMPDARIVAARVRGAAEPWPELFRRDRAIAAARAGLLAVRAVPPGCLLVRADVTAVHGPPPAALWDWGWSAAVLREGGGYLAPGAIADGPEVTTPLRARARMVALPGLTMPERLWLAFLLLRAPAAGHP